MDGFGVMHLAAGQGHLEVCKYLVEELRGDPNMIGGKGSFEGTTPFMMSAHSGDVCTVKYFLDHGGDPMKADAKGRSVLHYAVSRGSCKVTEFLLSKGIPVDIDCGYGTPLYHAATNEQDKTLKILLNHNANVCSLTDTFFLPEIQSRYLFLHFFSLSKFKMDIFKTGADVNGKGCVKSPLLFATSYGGYTEFVPLGWLPVELAAFRGCREEVELLLPLTSPIPDVPNWSIDGLISHAKFKRTKPLDKGLVENRKTMLKSETNLAFRRKDYVLALKTYSLLLEDTPDATLYSNRSLCKLKMGDGEGALSDAYRCRMMRPDWAKACYRQAAAHIYSR
ncbi:hypothetical protein PR202_ga12311 [Eleusine coracana subsp. coracana]|uniref:Serine/threonine-protein kinase BSK1-like TPR repeats domain-containing protein n=1 Tax=Eleusine coracana subsp. coracana TaxID=191504 RepID=A0AAV5CBU2_ELECO|nr:hypothetical protein PR202_ga12311 [Eleusine coracana subsp. coracana]